MDWSARHAPTLLVSLIGSTQALFRILDMAHELRRRAAAVDVDGIPDLPEETAASYWLTRSFLEAGVSASAMRVHATKAELLAREIGDRRNLYIALTQKAAGSPDPQEIDSMLAEIVALERGEWDPRVRCQRWIAEYAAHLMHERWLEALGAARTGFGLAIEAGSIALTAYFGPWMALALLRAGDVDRALECCREMRHHIIPGPAILAVPYLGLCARALWRRGCTWSGTRVRTGA